MTDFKITFDCANCSGSLPAYLDYILQGVPLPVREEVEEHLARCSGCAREYADLLGLALRERIEPLLDLVLAGEAGEEKLDAPIEYNHHWLEICTLLAEKAGAAAAHSHLGIIHELAGDLEQAVEFHLRALQRAAGLDNSDYVRLHSAAGLGRLYRKQGLWDEASKCLEISRQAADCLLDEYALARTFIELGDFNRRPRGYTTLVKAVRYYRRAAEIGERAGFTKGLEIARGRLARVKLDLSAFLRKHTKQYFRRYYARDVRLTDRFCRDFAARLIDDLAGSGGANRTQTLSLDQSFQGAGRSDILLTSADREAQWDSFQGKRKDRAASLLSGETLALLFRDLQALGLPQHEMEELARFLQEELARELAAEPGFIGNEL